MYINMYQQMWTNHSLLMSVLFHFDGHFGMMNRINSHLVLHRITDSRCCVPIQVEVAAW